MSPVDDPTIGDDVLLWRRIAPERVRVDHETGEQRPSDSAFRTEQMSVHIASLTGRDAVLANYPNHRLMELSAGEARGEGFIIVRDPLPEDPSHALVLRGDNPGQRPTKSQAKKLANCARWVV
jgi:hypothetical protein